MVTIPTSQQEFAKVVLSGLRLPYSTMYFGRDSRRQMSHSKFYSLVLPELELSSTKSKYKEKTPA